MSEQTTRPSSVAEAFQNRADRQAHSVAVATAFASETLTYAELDRWSHRIAAYLAGPAGVRHGDRVVVCLPRSPMLIAAFLGVLKAGAVCVPAYAAEPEQRRALLLADVSAAAALVDDTSHALFSGRGMVVVNPAALPKATREVKLPRVAADDLACLYFTSGSTGTPKAVGVTHGNILNLVTDPNFVTLDGSDRVLHHSPVTFDAATFEIWGPLLNGARLVLPPAHEVPPDEFGGMLRDSGITVLWLTAARFHQQIDLDVTAFRGLGTVLSGGDVLSAHHVEVLRKACPGLQIVNGYGPTEATTFTTCHRVGPDEDLSCGVPIGLPLQNVRVTVVGPEGSEVADGTSGELWIGGAGVSQGYWRRPELTARVFVKPSWPGAGGTYYRTGDRVRRRADGVLEFLGRVDHQFKLRGFRVEPGEVEQALVRHPRVRDAVVELRRNHRDDPQIVAWIVCPDGPPTRQILRTHLRRILPDYMVPAAYVVLDALPETHHGKVDRHALPTPDWTSRELYV